MQIYKRQSQYVLVTERGEVEFDSLESAVAAQSKIGYVERLRDLVTSLAKAADQAPDLLKLYFDRGYDGEGVSPITNLDVFTATGMQTGSVTQMVTLVEQFGKFCSAETVLAGDYKATMNVCRKDV